MYYTHHLAIKDELHIAAETAPPKRGGNDEQLKSAERKHEKHHTIYTFKMIDNLIDSLE